MPVVPPLPPPEVRPELGTPPPTIVDDPALLDAERAVDALEDADGDMEAEGVVAQGGAVETTRHCPLFPSVPPLGLKLRKKS